MKPLLYLSLGLLALSQAWAEPQSWTDAADDITASDPYVRAMPPGQPNTGAFMLLTNAAQAAHSVVGASSPVAEVLELHSHVMEDGMMKMRQVPQIDVPAGGSAELKPGGLHIMLINLKQPLALDQEVPITLKFEDGSSREITAPVRAIEADGGMQHHHHDMPAAK